MNTSVSTINKAISNINNGVSNINSGVSDINTIMSNNTLSNVNNALNTMNGISALNSENTSMITNLDNSTDNTQNAVEDAKEVQEDAKVIKDDDKETTAKNKTETTATAATEESKTETPVATEESKTETTEEAQSMPSSANQKTFDIDTTINNGLYVVVVIICYIMIFLFIIIFINAVANYILFQYHNINKMIIESDVYNLEKRHLEEAYEYQFIKYVYCSKTNQDAEKNQFDLLSYILDKVEEDPTSESTCKSTSENIDDSLQVVKGLLTSNKCTIEPHWNIYGENKFHSLCMQLLYLIIMIMLLGSTIYIIAKIFLTVRQWNVSGSNFMTYFYKHGSLYMYIILLVFLFCIVHSILFKYLFVDSIYDKLYKDYKEFVKLDIYINTEMKNIQEEEKQFLSLLTKSTRDDIDIEFETNNRNKKIIENITSSKNDDSKATKIFLYAIYIYFVRQNPDDSQIVNVINEIVKSENSLRTLRSLLMQVIDDELIKSDLNNIATVLLVKLGLNQEYEFFEFTRYTEMDQATIKYKVANKLNKFYETISKIDETVNLKRCIWEFNIYFIIMLMKSLVFLLLLFLLLYMYSDKDPFVKRIITWVIEGIKNMIDDLKWTMVM